MDSAPTRVFHDIAPLMLMEQLEEHELEKTKTTTTSLGLFVDTEILHEAAVHFPPSVP